MIDNLLSLFGVHQAGMVIGIASQVIRSFETEYAENHDAKIAALDTLISVLQKHKEKLTTPEATQ